MRKTSETVEVEAINPATEAFARAVFSDPETRKNLISPDLAPGSFQRWLYGKAVRYILSVASRPVGVATVMGAPPRCFFGYALAPEFRGRGLAGSCLAAIENHARKMGFKTMTTNVAEDNIPSIKTLESAEFRRFRWMEKGAVV
jgi:RimJ/RimL family protein N-acetyltransferase